MKNDFLSNVCKVTDSAIFDSNKRLEEYILGSLRKNGLETVVNIGEHKDGIRVSLQGMKSVYADFYLDGETIRVELSDKAHDTVTDAWFDRYAKFAGVPEEQAKNEVWRFVKWYNAAMKKSGSEPKELQSLKVSDAATAMEDASIDETIVEEFKVGDKVKFKGKVGKRFAGKEGEIVAVLPEKNNHFVAVKVDGKDYPMRSDFCEKIADSARGGRIDRAKARKAVESGRKKGDLRLFVKEHNYKPKAAISDAAGTDDGKPGYSVEEVLKRINAEREARPKPELKNAGFGCVVKGEGKPFTFIKRNSTAGKTNEIYVRYGDKSKLFRGKDGFPWDEAYNYAEKLLTGPAERKVSDAVGASAQPFYDFIEKVFGAEENGDEYAWAEVANALFKAIGGDEREEFEAFLRRMWELGTDEEDEGYVSGDLFDWVDEGIFRSEDLVDAWIRWVSSDELDDMIDFWRRVYDVDEEDEEDED